MAVHDDLSLATLPGVSGSVAGKAIVKRLTSPIELTEGELDAEFRVDS